MCRPTSCSPASTISCCSSRHQYEQPLPRIPVRRLVAPAFANNSSITFIGVTNDRGDVVESLAEFAPTNIVDREFFQTHRQIRRRPTADLRTGARPRQRPVGDHADQAGEQARRSVRRHRRDFDRAAVPDRAVRHHLARSAGRDVAGPHQRHHAGAAARRCDFVRGGHLAVGADRPAEGEALGQFRRPRRPRRRDANLQLSHDARLPGDRHRRHARARCAGRGAGARASLFRGSPSC